MTSAHRSQLEARNGGKNTVKNNIQHSRSLPSHQSLKYRSDYNKNDSWGNNNTDLDDDDGLHIELNSKERTKVKSLVNEMSSSLNEDIGVKGEEGEEEEEEEEEDSGLDSEEDSEEENEEDSEEDEMMKELERLKQQKQERVQSSVETDGSGDSKPAVHSSWRKKKVFNKNTNKVQKPNSNTTNTDNQKYHSNMTKNQYHQDLLKRVIR